MRKMGTVSASPARNGCVGRMVSPSTRVRHGEIRTRTVRVKGVGAMCVATRGAGARKWGCRNASVTTSGSGPEAELPLVRASSGNAVIAVTLAVTDGSLADGSEAASGTLTVGAPGVATGDSGGFSRGFAATGSGTGSGRLATAEPGLEMEGVSGAAVACDFAASLGGVGLGVGVGSAALSAGALGDVAAVMAAAVLGPGAGVRFDGCGDGESGAAPIAAAGAGVTDVPDPGAGEPPPEATVVPFPAGMGAPLPSG
jgi:hypothetical protein